MIKLSVLASKEHLILRGAEYNGIWLESSLKNSGVPGFHGKHDNYTDYVDAQLDIYHSLNNGQYTDTVALHYVRDSLIPQLSSACQAAEQRWISNGKNKTENLNSQAAEW